MPTIRTHTGASEIYEAIMNGLTEKQPRASDISDMVLTMELGQEDVLNVIVEEGGTHQYELVTKNLKISTF